LDDESKELAPKKQSLFELSADDVLENALQNLDEKQAREITKKAADEAVKLAVERRKAEHRSDAAQDEMRSLINNANLLDRRGGDYEIKSTFETATGTTEVHLRKSKMAAATIFAAAIGFLLLLAILVVWVVKQ
jgi:hypothetical protein